MNRACSWCSRRTWQTSWQRKHSMHLRNSCTRSTSTCAIRHVPSACGGLGLNRLMLFFAAKFQETSVTRSRTSGNARIGSTVTGFERSTWFNRVMHISRGLPFTSAEQDPHLPALQFHRTARSLACWAWIWWIASRTTMPSDTSAVYSWNLPPCASPRQIRYVAASGILPASCYAGCRLHRAGCIVQRAACNVQRATCSVQRATCNVQRAACNVQRAGATCSAPVQCADGATGTYAGAPGARTWLGHDALCTWHGHVAPARGTLHVAPCTWHLARGTLHVAPCTTWFFI